MFDLIKEYKKLNRYGEIIGIKRKFIETNNKYRERIQEHYKKHTQPEYYYGTLRALIETLENIGFKTYHIENDYENNQIKLTLSIF